MQQSFKSRHRVPAQYDRFQRKDNPQGDYGRYNRSRDYDRFLKRGSYVEIRRHRGRKEGDRFPWKQKKRGHKGEGLRNAEAVKEEEVVKYSPSDAEKAFELERVYQRSNVYVLKFPDPYLDKNTIKGFSSAILDVRVQQPITPRFVFVQLKPDECADKVIEDINRTPFANGYLRLEKLEPNANTTSCKDIDPLTIFIGGIPQFTPVQVVKQWLPHANRLDVGYAKRHRFGRYAFARYKTLEDSFRDFKAMKEGDFGADLIIRFRRVRGNVGMPNERNNASTSIKSTATVKVSNEQSCSGNTNGIVVIDSTDDEMTEEAVPTTLMTTVVKKEPNEDISQVMDIDWEKLRQQEISRYETKPDLSKLPSITFSGLPEPAIGADIPNDFEDLLSQLDCDLNYIFNEDFEL